MPNNEGCAKITQASALDAQKQVSSSEGHYVARIDNNPEMKRIQRMRTSDCKLSRYITLTYLL